MIMSRNEKRKAWNLILVIAISAVLGTWLITSSATAQAASNTSLSFTATADKAQYILGEPIHLTVRLTNTGTEPVNVPKYLDPKEGTIVVKVTTPQGSTFAYVPLSLLCSDSPPVALKPGEVAGGVFPIFYGARGWTFPDPGTYKIAVICEVEAKQRVRYMAEPLTLVVSTDKAGALIVNEGLASSQAAKFLLWQSGDHLLEGIALLERMKEKYPDSVLSDYASFALGKSLSRHFKDYSAKKVRLPDYKRSLEHLKKVKADKLPRYLRVQHNLVQAKCYIELNQPQRAKELVAKTRKLIADQPELLRFDANIARINRRLK